MIAANETKAFIKQTYQEWKDDNVMSWAAAVAYFTLFSIVPMMVIAVYILSFVFGQEAARGEIVTQGKALLGRSTAEFLQEGIRQAQAQQSRGGIWATLISSGLLLFGASKVFSELQKALNRIWDVRLSPEEGLKGALKKRALSFAMVLGVAFILLVSLILSTVFAVLGNYFSKALPGGDMLWRVVNATGSFAIIWGLFALIYKHVPDVRIAWSDVWRGAMVTAILFVVGKYLLSWYLGQRALGSTYGAAGSVLAFLVWVYYAAQIFFFGAELTQVYANRFGSGIRPDEDAVAV